MIQDPHSLKGEKKMKRLILMAASVALSLCGMSHSISAQPGSGKLFGTRDPHTCPDSTVPKGNMITADKAKEYVYCSESYTTQNIYLYDEVTVQVGTPRRYNPNEDVNVWNIDVSVPVNPIRGSLKQYQCAQAGEENMGKNCNVYDAPHASGLCYKDTFKDWHCAMMDYPMPLLARGAPPPGGAVQPRVPTTPRGRTNPQPDNRAQQQGNQPAQEKTADAAKDANGYPMPDMSAMDKWYEITKVEYGDPATDRQAHYVFKPKIEHYGRAALNFQAQYFDKDGNLIGSYPVDADHFTEVGEVGKGSFGMPSEKEMEKVASVKIVRIKQ
jgi:hypothetical protein